MQRAALPADAADDAATPSTQPTTSAEPCEINDAYHWLAALRLDRAAAAVEQD